MNTQTFSIWDFSHPSPKRTSSNCLSHKRPASGCPCKFRSRRTTGSSMFDHDLSLLCRGKRIHTSGHCDFGNLNNFGTSSILSWVQADTASAACPAEPCGLAMTSHYFRCCHLRRRRTLFSKVQHKIQNHLSQCHLGERLVPCFFGYIGCH